MLLGNTVQVSDKVVNIMYSMVVLRVLLWKTLNLQFTALGRLLGLNTLEAHIFRFQIPSRKIPTTSLDTQNGKKSDGKFQGVSAGGERWKQKGVDSAITQR